ncbi:hypothetical protein DL89DRAFT_312100 [Linderina pennispora]|uniref:CUE domain-containing protein n=1 Tax=Linderina pennispora TaxID=61395 RepID=A0A1Y1WFQ9_9FUNG|nr:uncharacterized protein DL89DRAFT_312100 [Linderina pennispora]ORX72235.1 hypothetical protein DL89DRAFT_312100 [Linderina pennispora]
MRKPKWARCQIACSWTVPARLQISAKELVLDIYGKLSNSLGDPAAQDYIHMLQSRYILVGATLFDLARVFGTAQTQQVEGVLDQLCANAPWLLSEIEAAYDLLMEQLTEFERRYTGSGLPESLERVCRDLQLHLGIAQSWRGLAEVCIAAVMVLAQDKQCLLRLSRVYGTVTHLVVGLERKAMDAEGKETYGRIVELAKKLKWQWCSLAFHICRLLLDPAGEQAKHRKVKAELSVASGSAVFMELLDSMETQFTELVPFSNAPILFDIEFGFGLRPMLRHAAGSSGDFDEAQLDYIIMSIDQLRAQWSSGNDTEATANDSAIDAEVVAQVQELIPDLGAGFVRACLAYYDLNPEAVIMAILEDNLPPSLAGLDRTMADTPVATTAAPTTGIPSTAASVADESAAESDAPTAEHSALDARRNIFDNDEFDIFRRNTLDWSRVHRKKADEQTDINAGDHAVKSRIMEIVQRIEEDDEYDDTYDDTVQDNAVNDAQDADEFIDASKKRGLPEPAAHKSDGAPG